MTKNDLPIFEYACHEGNYGLYNIMAGAREKEAAMDAAEAGR
jgi:hypothetical protein